MKVAARAVGSLLLPAFRSSTVEHGLAARSRRNRVLASPALASHEHSFARGRQPSIDLPAWRRDHIAIHAQPDPTDPPSSYRAIENLTATYAELVDEGDPAGVGTVLADATFTGAGGSVSGRDAIEKMLRDSLIVYDDGTPRTKHVTTNVAVEVDEEAGTAVSRSYFTALQALPDLALQPIVSGRYQDRFERRRRALALRGEARPNRSRRRCEPPPAPRWPLSASAWTR
jgi:SnoaL-like domain